MERRYEARDKHSDETGRKPDFVGARFAAWNGVSKNGRENLFLKDERTGKSVYLNKTFKEE